MLLLLVVGAVSVGCGGVASVVVTVTIVAVALRAVIERLQNLALRHCGDVFRSTRRPVGSFSAVARLMQCYMSRALLRFAETFTFMVDF